jgi:hypothetical protein
MPLPRARRPSRASSRRSRPPDPSQISDARASRPGRSCVSRLLRARAAGPARAAGRARPAGGPDFCQMFTTRALVRAFLTIGHIARHLSGAGSSSPRACACFPTRDATRTHRPVTSARLVTICQEQHASQRVGRRRKPAADVGAPRRQRRVECRGVSLYTSYCGSIIRQHQEFGHAPHEPAAFARDVARQSERMEGEDIDAAALAPDVERHLGRDFPPKRPKAAQHLFGEVRMGAVEQPIETLALP